MDQGDKGQPVSNSEDISIAELVDKIKSAIKYIKTKWVSILVASLLGATLGLCYSLLKKPTYTAVCTFVLEDVKDAVSGQYSGLASLTGINMGGGGGGIFSGENILELYKSRIMIEKALLSVCSFNGKKQLLIDRFMDQNGLRKQSTNDGKGGENKFYGDPDHFNRKQDSIVTVLVANFNKNILNVFKPDKKLNIIRVEVTTTDELFSKFFTEKLVQTVSDFYIQTKTKKAGLNVQILQHQADSVRMMLNSFIHGVASATDADPNANPLMSTLREVSQKRQIDVQINSSIYSEMLKDLETAKISLRREMPLIQVIDKPVLPLQVNRVTKLKSIILGAILGAFVALTAIIVKNAYDYLLQK